MRVGYIRVSTVDQNLDRQLAGLELDKVFEDKASGKDRNRPGLKGCLEFLREADTLFVHSIDRLARDLYDLQGLVNSLTGKGVTVRFVKEGLTFAPDASAAPMDKMLLQVLGAFAEFERAMIRERQREGLAIARAKGRKHGRPKAASGENRSAIIARSKAGENKAALAREFGVSRGLVYRILKEAKAQEAA